MEYIEKYYSIVKELDNTIDDLKVQPATVVDQYILACVASLIEKGNATVCLLSKGHQLSSVILFRNIAEISIDLILTLYFEMEHIHRTVISSHEERIKKYKFLLRCKKPPVDKKTQTICDNQIKYHQSQIAKIKKHYNGKIGSIHREDAFRMADFEGDYAQYQLICESVHSNVITLMKSHASEIDDGMVDMGKPLDDKEMFLYLDHISELLIYSIGTTFEYYEQKTSHFKNAVKAYIAMKSAFTKQQQGQTKAS